jgi:hypothetical protein
MLFGRPLMIHDRDAYLVHLPTAQDDQYIMPTSIFQATAPSKMTFYIATCQLYRILGDILRELYSPRDDYRIMMEEQWLSKVSSIMRFDKELKDWLSKVPRFLQWGSDEEVSDDILRQRNVLQVRYVISLYVLMRMLNVRNLLYRPSLILLGRMDYGGESGLDLSTTLTCARFCVASAKDTIQLLHSTASRLTGAFWYNIFCILLSNVTNSDIYTAATVLLGARLCLKKRELDDIEEDWNLALSYLKRISSKSISAERCLKVLEVMHSQISRQPIRQSLTTDASPKVTHDATPAEVKPDTPKQPVVLQYDPLAPPPVYPTTQGNVVDWDMQDLVWSNLPWDWNLMDDLMLNGTGGNEGGWGWANVVQGEGGEQTNGEQSQQGETMGMPVL